MTRTLSLRRESLTELSTDELTNVVGAQLTPSCPLVLRITDLLDCYGAGNGRGDAR